MEIPRALRGPRGLGSRALAVHGKEMNEMFESLNNIDWNLLHQQKLLLLKMLECQQDGSAEAEALSGIINLLDTLQDEAADTGIWAFPGEQATEGGA